MASDSSPQDKSTYIIIRTDVPLLGDAVFCFVREGSGRDTRYDSGSDVPLAPEMAHREIGIDPTEGTSCSPPGQKDRFPSKAHSESPVPLVLASSKPVDARRDAVPTASPVPLVLEKARDTGPPVPIVPPLETGEWGMREAIQLFTRMVSIHER
uniref:Uncharacterized protein n=1 Tax=Solanum tuberosum TaxID=4113 RepID=M1DD63_SOLTU